METGAYADDPVGSPEGAIAEEQPRLEKIIVAIHGIGSQLRSSTIRSVAHRFGNRSHPPLPVMPLGFFNIAEGSAVRWSRLVANQEDGDLAKIGFAEVYWADIPKQLVQANDTLEESKAWGRTVVSRAQATYTHHVKAGKLTPEDFGLGIGVVEEVIETIGVLENLLTIADKAGIFKFEIGGLLNDYIGDVQIVTEFPYYRDKILYRFHETISAIIDTYTKCYPGYSPEIYIVAHSEGTVISFMGLLQALCGKSIVDPESKHPTIEPTWVTRVRGFMTIGSPIDKHIALWPALWDGFKMQSHSSASGQITLQSPSGKPITLNEQIKWRNYFDYADPVGFQLDTAVDFLHEINCDAFQFITEKHDYGYSRSLLPGKAHIDYWEDNDVFAHFIDDVVLLNGESKAVAPKNRKICGLISKLVPYAVSLSLHMAAVFVIYKAVTSTSASKVSEADALGAAASSIGWLTALLFCVTVAARVPRLVKPRLFRWKAAALVALLAGAGSVTLLSDAVASFFAFWLVKMPFADPTKLPMLGRLTLLTAASLLALIAGWLVPRKPKIGRRTLIAGGCFLVGMIVLARYRGPSPTPPIWPAVTAGAFFIYLWWLGILVFDLAFVWHRYIREAVFVKALRHWRRGKDAPPCTKMGLGAAPPETVTTSATGIS